MKKLILPPLLLILTCFCLCAQVSPGAMQYEPSQAHPFGQLNPEAPSQVGDFAPMIGKCTCRSLSRNPDGTWADTVDMVWQFKYVLNGTAVQDEVWRDGNYASSIRQYQADSAQWVVSYYSYPIVAYNPGVWHGAKQNDGTIVLKQSQVAPNGMQGHSVLTFYGMSDQGFNWKGAWVKDDETITYPFRMIWCHRQP